MQTIKLREFNGVEYLGDIQSVETRENRVTIQEMSVAKITLSIREIFQLLLGAEIFLSGTINAEGFYMNSLEENDSGTLQSEVLYAISLLMYMKNLVEKSKKQNEEEFETKDYSSFSHLLQRKTLKIFKQFLDCRMKHCEDEREEGSGNFNPDTYIVQKLLLINIREALLGTIIE